MFLDDPADFAEAVLLLAGLLAARRDGVLEDPRLLADSAEERDDRRDD